MCCRKVCTKSATTASGTQLGASTLNEPASCSCSTVPQHRHQLQDPLRRSAQMIGQLVTRDPTSPESARAVSRAVSFASLAFIPNRQADHDPYCFVAKLNHSFQRASVMPRLLCGYRSSDYALSPRSFNNSPRITPPYRPMATIYPLMLFV
jgi:hypothetical protein